MLIRELLLETTNEDRALSSLTTALYQVTRRYAATHPNGGLLGKIEDLVDTPLIALNTVSIRLLPNKLFYAALDGSDTSAEGTGVMGFWDPSEETVVLNMEYVADPRWNKTIAHELRHALDDVKSGYNVADDSGYVNHPKGELHAPHEINARYMAGMHAALLKIQRMRNEGATEQDVRSKLPSIVGHALDANNITRVMPDRYNNPAYKRLASRAYQLLSTEVDHLYRQ